jgi:hypothetical protein
MRWLPPLALSILAADLSAQTPVFRASLGFSGGFSGGSYGFTSDLAGFDDDADADLVQAEFEATSARGFGGGLRYERSATESGAGLFRDPAFPADPGLRATNDALRIHFTYRLQQHRFEMPIRAGLHFGGLTLEDEAALTPDTRYSSFGPFFEVEPELLLLRAGAARWSVYGQLGVGIAGTAIEIDGDPRDYRSDSALFDVEFGTRVSFGLAEIGLAFVGRYQSMNPSDVEAGQFVYGFDAGFEGVMLSAGVRF